MERVDEICRKALDTFGTEAQIDMCIEECAELINALEKYRRGRNTPADVITEIADVQIMCEQMQELFGSTATNAERHKKLTRLSERIVRKEWRDGKKDNQVQLPPPEEVAAATAELVEATACLIAAVEGYVQPKKDDPYVSRSELLAVKDKVKALY